MLDRGWFASAFFYRRDLTLLGLALDFFVFARRAKVVPVRAADAELGDHDVYSSDLSSPRLGLTVLDV